MAGTDRRWPPEGLGRTYLLLLLAILFWGGSPIGGKLAVREIPPITVGVVRYGCSAAILIALFWGRLPDLRGLRRADWWLLAAAGTLGTFLNHIFFYWGLVLAPASHAAILSPTTSPIWTLLFAAYFAGEGITRRQAVGAGVCVLGVVLVAQADILTPLHGGREVLGDGLLLLSGLAWGLYSFVSKLAMRHLSPLATLAYGMAIGSVGLVPLALLEQPWRALRAASPEAWLSVAYVTLVCTILASFWWNLAIQRIGAGKTAIFGNLTPVAGVFLAWRILGDRLAAVQLLGGLLTVAGVWICQGPGMLRAAFGQAGDKL